MWSFNRYIVECKFVKSDIQTLIDKSFNRYIVECKYVRSKGKEFDGLF